MGHRGSFVRVAVAAVALVACGASAAAAQSREAREQADIGCDPTARTDRSPRFGLGPEFGLGRQHGEQPLNHLAFLVGAVWDLHLTSSFGLGGHADFLFGGEAGEDADADGRDDVQTGDRRAFLTTAGLRLRLPVGDASMYVGAALGAGYLVEMKSGESGALVDATALFGEAHGGRVELGLRYLGGVGTIRDTRSLLLVGTLSTGGGPDITLTGGCPGFRSGARVAYGFGVHTTLLGMNLRRSPDASVPGVGVRFLVRLGESLDAFVEVDLLTLKPRYEDPVTLQTVAAGLRFQRSTGAPLSVSLGGGYSRAHGPQGGDPGSGPSVGASVGYDLAGSSREGFYVLVGSRLGASRDNRELRIVWVGLRAEFRSSAYRH